MIAMPLAHTAAPGQSADPMRVLVVDDDPIYRETARMFLNMFGRKVTLADCGRAGLALLARETFDIMVVDMEMPDMNGLQVIAEVRAMPDYTRMPIIMVTSRDDAMAIDRAFELGASSFVVKPVNWTLLNHYLRFVSRAAQNEAEARTAQANAEAVSRMKDNLLSVLRHEMKTPLNAIVGFTRLATEARASGNLDEMRDHLQLVSESGRTLLDRFGDMNLYSDLISGRVQPKREALQVDWVLDDAWEANAALRASAPLEIRRSDDAAGVRISGDPDLLASALTRVLRNALQHAQEAQKVEVSIERVGAHEVRYRIFDDGQGIDPARIPNCLAPFLQDDMSLARRSEGLGLGLPIALEIVRLHGGRLDMHSEPGVGTRVDIILPVAT